MKGKNSALIVETMKDLPADVDAEEEGGEEFAEVDGAGQLKEMFGLLKSGDSAGAWDVFQDLVASCK